MTVDRQKMQVKKQRQCESFTKLQQGPDLYSEDPDSKQNRLVTTR